MKTIIAFFFAAFLAGASLAQDHIQTQSAQPQSPPQGWYQQHSTAIENSGAIFFVNRDTGWVTFGDGLFKTFDGGNTWTFLLPPPVYIYNFADANNGWGQNDTALIRTSDGGKNWHSVHAPILGNMQVFGMDTIYLRSGDGEFARSTNAGITWTDTVLSVSQTRSMSFADSKFGFIGGNQIPWFGPSPPQKGTNGAAFWLTIDSGNIWHQKYCPLQDDIDVLYALDHQNIIASAHNQSTFEGFIVRTGNGGSTWDTVCIKSSPTSYSFPNKSIGYGADVGGHVLFTADTGKTWVIQYTPVTANLNSIFFVDSLTGWASGNAGVILHTINGGKSWVRQQITIDTLNLQTYPNPASSTMTVGFTLPQVQHVSISILDLTGKEMMHPYLNEIQPRGINYLPINIHSLPAGIYLLHISTELYDGTVKFTKIVP